MNQKVLFGIVLYKSYINESKSLSSLLVSSSFFPGVSPNIILYDNSEITYDYAKVNESIANSSGYVFFHNPNNPGLPAAYNYFLHVGLEMGFEWLVIMDQDTLLPENTFRIYMEAALERQIHSPVKVPIVIAENIILSPSRIFLFRNILFKRLRPGRFSLKNLAFINSGIMLNIQFVKGMNGFNERLKLDFVDTEFSLRLKSRIKEIEVLSLTLTQTFSHFTDSFEGSKSRFFLYNNDLRTMLQIYPEQKIALKVNLILHSLKLCFKYKTFYFLKILFR